MEVKREIRPIHIHTEGRLVSILVLMEVKREGILELETKVHGLVSILVLMEVKRESMKMIDYALLHWFQSLF